MWWSEIGVLGRVSIVVAIQIIACLMFGGWGLLVFPVIGVILYIYAWISVNK